MEKDYFGSLLGGVFFAFVGLPYLGLTYTPFLLGFINFFGRYRVAADGQKAVAAHPVARRE